MTLDDILEEFIRDVDKGYHDPVKLKKAYEKAKRRIKQWMNKEVLRP